MDKIPEWLTGVNVTFVCTNCPNRQTQKITQITLETPVGRSTPEEGLQELEKLESDDDED
jgi:hypothetical protein